MKNVAIRKRENSNVKIKTIAFVVCLDKKKLEINTCKSKTAASVSVELALFCNSLR